MASRKLLLLSVVAALAAPASASASFAHVIAPGESLASVAAADGLSVSALAAANGISSDSLLSAGATLQIPPQGVAVTAAPSTAVPSADPAVDPDGDGDTDGAPASASAGPSTASVAVPTAASPSGSYLVAPGDTLSAIAVRYGTTVDQLAAANGLNPAGFLISGTSITLSGSGASGPSTQYVSSSAPASTSPASSATVSSSAGAQPTPETVSAADVGSVAAANGVSPSLAEAIGYQESGFNNGLVSSSGATGVMQIEPGTWNYIGQNLAGPPPLSPTSAQDNIRGGVLLLRSLLNQAGGDPALAAAGYYQGLQSVRQNGMYADTQQYVANVLALRQRFGGP